MAEHSKQTILQELTPEGSPVNNWNLIGKCTFMLGREPTNDIVLPFSWISRKHTMIQRKSGDTFHVMDLGSSNGTYLNNKRIQAPAVLTNGDLINLGKTAIKFIQSSIKNTNYDKDKSALTHDMEATHTQKGVATILVCDIHDFTSLSEKLGDKLIAKLLQFWRKKVEAIIHEHGGLIDNFIANAVIATWVGGAANKGARNALRAALEINNITGKIEENIPEINTELSIGAAVNSGEAMVDNMGVNSLQDSTVIGDVVNVTFRLESMTVKDEIDIIIGEETTRHLDNPEKYFNQHTFELKGRTGKISAQTGSFDQLRYFLLSTATSTL